MCIISSEAVPSAQAVNGNPVLASPKQMTALRVLLYAFSCKITHGVHFDLTLTDFCASSTIPCMWKGRGLSTPRKDRTECNWKWVFFDIMVLAKLSLKKKMWFSSQIVCFAGKTQDLFMCHNTNTPTRHQHTSAPALKQEGSDCCAATAQLLRSSPMDAMKLTLFNS